VLKKRIFLKKTTSFAQKTKKNEQKTGNFAQKFLEKKRVKNSCF